MTVERYQVADRFGEWNDATSHDLPMGVVDVLKHTDIAYIRAVTTDGRTVYYRRAKGDQ